MKQELNRKSRCSSPTQRPSQNRLHQYEALEPRQLLASLYVDNSGGSDGNDGLSLGTAFASIQAAANQAQAGDTVFVRAGVYREQVTLPNSGTAGNPIAFQAYNNENVVISGADLVTNWTRHNGDIWKATVNWNANNNRKYNTLFANGTFQQEARQGAENDYFDIGDWGQLPSGRIVDNASSFRVDDLSGFSDDYWNGAQVRFHTHDWVVETRTISDFSSNGTINFDTPLAVTSQKQTNGYYIFDSLNAVDKPGEWYKDTGNTLYYQVQPGQDANNLTLEFKRRAFAFSASGRDYIHLDGFDFRGNSIQTSSSTDHNVYQNNDFQGYDTENFGRLIISGTNNTLRDNELSHVWGAAVSVNGLRNSVVNNYLHHIGYAATARAVSVSSASEFLFSHNTVQTFARSLMDGYPSRSEISYNVIEDGGLLSWDTGVFDSDGGNGNSSNSVFHHNIIRNTDTRGIFEAFYGRNNNAVIHHNVVHDFNNGSGRTVFRASGNEFRQAYHNTLITGTGEIPAGSLDASQSLQTRYNNNLQLSTDRMAAIGVDVRGNLDYAPSDFVDFAGKDFQLTAGSEAIDRGVVLPGVNDGYVGAAPDAGAYEFGAAPWTAGHDFVNKPNPVYAWVSLPGTNLYDNGQFLNGIGDWQIVSGSPNSLDRNSWNLQASGAALTGNFRTQSVEFTPGESIRGTFTGLTPNSTYTLGANARVANRVTNGSGYDASSGSVNNGTRRNESYVTGFNVGEWVRYDAIDFGAAGQFDQLDLLHIRDPANGFPTIDGVSVQVRLDAAVGPLLAEFTNLTSGAGGDAWRADRVDFLSDVSGEHSLYVSVTGSNSANLAVGSFRLLNSAPSPADLLKIDVTSPGAESVTAKVGNEDWYPGYDEITFKTGANATTALIQFSNDGQLDAYLDRFFLLSGTPTRGGNPRSLLATGTAQRSDGSSSVAANEVIDGSIGTSVRTSNDAGSWIQVEMDEAAEIHSIRLLPELAFSNSLTNFRLSVWGGDPQNGGTELWSQDYLTDGNALGSYESLVVQADSYGRDGSTLLGDINGRFVRIQSLGPNSAGTHVLALAEFDVQLFDANNLAVTDGVATQSTTNSNETAATAIDGDPTTLSSTLAGASNSWWQVRLSQPVSIGQIELVNHDGSNFAELSNFTVSVWDDAPDDGGTKLWEKAYFQSGSIAAGGSLKIDGSEVSDTGALRLASAHTGKFVRVQLNGNNNAGNGRLSLADVRIAGSNAAKPVANIAQNSVASQSSDHYGISSFLAARPGYASIANDGIIETQSNLTSTLSEGQAWWQVDFQRTASLDQIVLFNRLDAANRLNNFKVSVWDGNPDAGGAVLWSRDYNYSSSAATYSTSSIGPGGALLINGDTIGNGRRLDSIDNARFVRVQLNGTNFLSLIEAQVWESIPATAAGEVELDQTSYSVGQQVTVTVRDLNAAGAVQVNVDRVGGGNLPLTLTGSNGVYQGSFTLVDGVAGPNELSISAGDSFSVSYLDSDDGTGAAVTVMVSASVTDLITITATGLPIAILDNQTITSTINVAAAGELTDIELALDITHTYNGDMIATLIAPNGERVTLFNQIGGSANNFTGTVLALNASESIVDQTAPFTGRFRPQAGFQSLLGDSITGDWTLEIQDTFGTDSGTLNAWSLSLGAELQETIVDTSLSTYRYDLGPAGDNEIFDGTYELLDPTVAGDIRWTSPVQAINFGPGQNGLNRDVIRKQDGPSTLEHKVANGLWHILVTVGDDDLALDQVSLAAEGQVYKSNISRMAGQFANEIFEATVTDGSLSLEFADAGGANGWWSASRVVLTRLSDLPTAPEVVQSLRDGGAMDGTGLARPDQLNTLQVQFDQDVNVNQNDLQLVNNSDNGALVDTSAVGFAYDTNSDAVTWNFGSLTEALTAGYYTYQLAESVTGVVGDLPLVGTGGSATFSESLYVAIPGDADLDGSVSVLGDATLFVNNLGTQTGATWAMGDFDGDGDVDVLGDAAIMVQNLGRNVVPTTAVTAATFARATSPIQALVEASEPTLALLGSTEPSRVDLIEADAGGFSLAGDYDLMDGVFGEENWG